MKHFAALLGLLLAVAVLPARAQQTPDDQYIAIYNLMQQADLYAANGQPGQAVAAYTQAHGDLERFDKVYPDWNSTLVNFRLKYLANKINSLRAQLPTTNQPPLSATTPTNAAASAELQKQLNALRTQVQDLRANNQTLQAKLKEALRVEPAEVSTSELAKAQAQIESLMKDNGLLKAELAQAKAGPTNPPVAAPRNRQVAELKQKLSDQTARAEKLARENRSLQARLQPLRENSKTMDALRGENAKLKRQLAVATKTARKAGVGADAELARLRAQIAVLHSNAQIHALEKAALEKRLRRFEAGRSGGAAEPGNDPAEPAAPNMPASGRAPAAASPAVPQSQATPRSQKGFVSLEPSSPDLNAVAVPAEKSMSDLPPGVASLVAEAKNYFSAGQYDLAAADYRRILQSAPTNAQVLANLAAIELQENKLSDAETHIQAALAQSPNDAYALSTFGILEFRQHRFDQALGALRRAAKLDPSNPQIQTYLGATLGHKGLYQQAEKALRKAIELDPSFGAAHNNLAAVYLSEKPPFPALARLEYQRALANGQPRNPELEKLLAEKGAPVSQ